MKMFDFTTSSSTMDPLSPSSPSSTIIHPYTTGFHLFFRFFPLGFYLFLSRAFSFTFVYVIVILLLSLDFWVVKNVSGRIMAGLRWWNYVNEEGDSQWIFESRPNDSQFLMSSSEIRIFWITLFCVPAWWTLCFFTSLMYFNPQWLSLVIIAITLNGSNLLGYLRCKFGSKNDGITSSLSGFANSYVKDRIFNNVMTVFQGKSSSTNIQQTV